MSQPTARLLTAGIIAGPLFVATWAVQALTRDGYDPARHPLSLLSLGGLGWIQIANFVVTGALFLACAAGLRRALHPGRAGTWGPILVGANGIGLILAGVFRTDPGGGFPPGAPAGAPEQLSWHGALHEVGFILYAVAWFAACFVFLRRFATQRQRRWVAACLAAPVLVLVVSGWPDPDSVSLRLLLGTAISFGFLAAVAAQLRRGLPAGAPEPARLRTGRA